MEYFVNKIKNTFKGFRSSIIGLDIGSSSIKLVKFIKKNGADLSFVNSQVKEFDVFVDAECRYDEIARILKDLTKELKGADVVCGITSQDIETKIITVPKMPVNEILDTISLQFASDVCIDFEILSETIEDDTAKYKLFVSACKKDVIEKYYSIFESLGIKVAAIIPVSYALYKLSQNYNKKDNVVCYLDIGAYFSECIILKGQELLFYCKLSVSGFDFTNALTATLGTKEGMVKLSLEQAEIIKRKQGIHSNAKQNKVLSLLMETLERMTSELKRYINYLEFDSIILSGRGSYLKGLREYLSSSLNVEVCEFREETAVFGIARSLALWYGKVNLLPDRIKKRAQNTLIRYFILLSATIFIITSMLVYIGLKIKLSIAVNRNNSFKKELLIMEPYFKKDLPYKILNKEPQWQEVFKEISNVVPDNSYVEELDFNNQKIYIKGIIVSVNTEEVLGEFIDKLGKGMFRNVKLSSLKNVISKQGKRFELECALKYD